MYTVHKGESYMTTDLVFFKIYGKPKPQDRARIRGPRRSQRINGKPKIPAQNTHRLYDPSAKHKMKFQAVVNEGLRSFYGVDLPIFGKRDVDLSVTFFFNAPSLTLLLTLGSQAISNLNSVITGPTM